MIVDSNEKMKFVRCNFKDIQTKLWNKNSKAENHFRNLLNESKIPHFREKGNYKFNTRWCYYDFYIPYLRLYVEIDGKEHKLRDNQIIDEDKERIINRKKRFILRLENDFVLSETIMNYKSLIDLLVDSNPEEYRDKFKRKYFNNLYDNYNQSIASMKKMANFKIDENQEIFFYDNKTGQYYKCKNIFNAKMITELPINHINKLINSENKRNLLTRLVFGFSMDECKMNVKKTYGLI